MHSHIKSFHPDSQTRWRSDVRASFRGGIHLRDSTCRGYLRGNLLITPSVVSWSTRAPIHQRVPICQSHSLLLVSRVLQVGEFVASSVLYMHG